jgi:hypothetical protein
MAGIDPSGVPVHAWVTKGPIHVLFAGQRARKHLTAGYPFEEIMVFCEAGRIDVDHTSQWSAGEIHFTSMRASQGCLIRVESNPGHQYVTDDSTAHISAMHERYTTKHPLLVDVFPTVKYFTQPMCHTVVKCHE